eukprot:792616-Pleurochrysis_carterae.AAC.2
MAASPPKEPGWTFTKAHGAGVGHHLQSVQWQLDIPVWVRIPVPAAIAEGTSHPDNTQPTASQPLPERAAHPGGCDRGIWFDARPFPQASGVPGLYH